MRSALSFFIGTAVLFLSGSLMAKMDQTQSMTSTTPATSNFPQTSPMPEATIPPTVDSPASGAILQPRTAPTGTTTTTTTSTTRPSRSSMTNKRSNSMSSVSRDQVRDVQTVLTQSSTALVPDGVMGAQTEEALRRYQSQNGLEITGRINSETLNHMGLESGRSPSSLDIDADPGAKY